MSISYQHYQCDRNWMHNQPSSTQCRGITTWNLDNSHTISPIAPGDSRTLTFTCTVPKCYSSQNKHNGNSIQGRDACLIVFNAWTQNTSPNDDIELKYTLNGNTHDIGSHISRFATHGGTQAFDIANSDSELWNVYDDMGLNTFVITNTCNNSTVQIDHFKIYRIYKTCNIIGTQHDSLCVTPINPNIPTICEPYRATGISGTLDYPSRIDTPCNYNTEGGLSFSHCQNPTHLNSTIPAGGSISWTFNFNNNTANPTGYTGNYVGESICLFNFNQIKPVDTSSSVDVQVDARLNGTLINTYYLSKVGGNGMFPSHDIAKETGLYNALGPNTVTLENKSDVDIKMDDPGGIDIYRIFETNSLEYTSFCDNVCQLSQGWLQCDNCTTNQNCGSCVTGYEPCTEEYEISCQEECELCETTCELNCQTGCQVNCQTGCQANCQDCQTGCEVECQYGCQVSCQDGCELSCQTCDVCQGGCYVSCQYFCVTCDACYSFCQDCYTCQGCEGCQTGCQVNCQGGCQSCQMPCEIGCQTECESCANCYQDCHVACYEYVGREDTTPTTTKNTPTTQTANNTQQNQHKTTQTQNPTTTKISKQNPPQTTNTNNPTPTRNPQTNNKTNSPTRNPQTTQKTRQTPPQNTNNNTNNPTPINNTRTPKITHNNVTVTRNPQTNNNPKPNTQTPNSNNSAITRRPTNFKTTPITNDDHIKEILIEALIELDIITQPPKRKQMQ